jgi:hypothetical protein
MNALLIGLPLSMGNLYIALRIVCPAITRPTTRCFSAMSPTPPRINFDQRLALIRWLSPPSSLDRIHSRRQW